MPLININADFKLLVRELRRIANALERHLLYAYNYRSEALVEKPGLLERGPARRGDVSYSDNESTIKHDVDVALKRSHETPDDADAEDEEDENVFI